MSIGQIPTYGSSDGEFQNVLDDSLVTADIQRIDAQIDEIMTQCNLAWGASVDQEQARHIIFTEAGKILAHMSPVQRRSEERRLIEGLLRSFVVSEQMEHPTPTSAVPPLRHEGIFASIAEKVRALFPGKPTWTQ